MGNILSDDSDQAMDDFGLSALVLSDNEHEDEDDFYNMYEENLRLQETLLADARDVHNSNSKATITATSAPSPKPVTLARETGESSRTRSFCEICRENKEGIRMITVSICRHSFCSNCVIEYVKVKIQDKCVSVIRCPGFKCRGVLEPKSWRSIVPKDLLDLYNDTLCELSIPNSRKFYCPFENCSAVLENDCTGNEVIIRESECPVCRRLFCAFCRVPWHSGISCEEFQCLNEDEKGSEDVKVRALAKEKNWNRCRSCSMYVEKNEGCQHITCRCGAEWCYKCGEKWSETHGGCQRPLA